MDWELPLRHMIGTGVASDGAFGAQGRLGDLHDSLALALRLGSEPVKGLGFRQAVSGHQHALGSLDDLAVCERLAEVLHFPLELEDLAMALLGEDEGREERLLLEGRDEIGHDRVFGGALDEAQRGAVGDDHRRERLGDAQADEHLERVPVGERDAGDDKAFLLPLVLGFEVGAGSAGGDDLGAIPQGVAERTQNVVIGMGQNDGAGHARHARELRGALGADDQAASQPPLDADSIESEKTIAARPGDGDVDPLAVKTDTAGDGSLSQIVYLSTRGPTLETSEIVDGIVLPAMRRNYQLDVTGCLWFGPSHFVHVLEGPTDVVFRLYAKIKVDPRHHDVRLLNSGAIAVRRFERFSMKVIESEECTAINRLIARFAAPGLDEPLHEGDEPGRMSAQALVDVVLRWMGGSRSTRAK